MRKRYRAAVLGVALLTSMSVTPALTAHATEPVPNCYASQADNPHVSVGAGGIIGKARYKCTPGVTYLAWSLYLNLCVNGPGQACTIVAHNSGAIPAPAPMPAVHTRYVPESGVPGLHGTGWWYTDTFYYSTAGSVVLTGYSRSADVYLSA